MKKWLCLLFILSLSTAFGQSFDLQAYRAFMQSNENKSADALIAECAPAEAWYDHTEQAAAPEEYAYLDSIQIKFELSEDELALLARNRFMVTERLSYSSMGHALHQVYADDLPVFISSDAVLHALHCSYDKILMDLEVYVIEPLLTDVLTAMTAALPELVSTYQNESILTLPLQDADLYLTVARSLLENWEARPAYADISVYQNVMAAIQNERAVDMPLFSTRDRHLDFSQFTVRGHYNHEIYTAEGVRNLKDYFKAMMWLGRIEIWMTPPPLNPYEEAWKPEEIQRMGLAGMILNELIDRAGQRENLSRIDRMIAFLVGESDNLTPSELASIARDAGVASARELTGLEDWQAFQSKLLSSDAAQQKILSNMIMMDPFSDEPGQLPVSFRLMGQRFIVDSYVFANVVFDNIVYEGKKVWRPLPDPLDAMAVLGNDNAVPLLEEELETYHYASQLSCLRYLIESYPDDFWTQSLYNVWLQSLRELPGASGTEQAPLFMKSTAWQQKTLNTQLGSWAQLRHDNLLYAKQSYTGMTGCSYPHSYVEPVPGMYARMIEYAKAAAAFFEDVDWSRFPGWERNPVQYYQDFSAVCERLLTLANKELSGEAFSTEEKDWLQVMLFEDGGSGRPPYTGWYADLYYDIYKAGEPDYTIADVHTQPTDQAGAMVGHVLHVSVGEINLGVVLTQNDAGVPMAFCGPFFSYYEQVSRDFKRYTDQEWESLVWDNNVPERPDWVNIYLADAKGHAREKGRELQGQSYSDVPDTPVSLPAAFKVFANHPNPFNPSTVIRYQLPAVGRVRVEVFNARGRLMEVLVDASQAAGSHQLMWHAAGVPSGIYVARITAGTEVGFVKMMRVK